VRFFKLIESNTDFTKYFFQLLISIQLNRINVLSFVFVK
jgi:hypothetical protein